MYKNKIKQLVILSTLVFASFVFASGMCKILNSEDCQERGGPCLMRFKDGTTLSGIIESPTQIFKCMDGSPGNIDCTDNAYWTRCDYTCHTYIIEGGQTNFLDPYATHSMEYESTIPEGSPKCK